MRNAKPGRLKPVPLAKRQMRQAEACPTASVQRDPRIRFPGREKRATMEMRKEIRYRLDAPAVFSWEGANCKRFQGEGITRDISVQGAFILTATMPPPDCPIQVDLLLPSLAGMNSMMRVTGKAHVVRIEHPSSDAWIHGFAVVADERNQWGLMTMQDDSDIAVAGAGRAH